MDTIERSVLEKSQDTIPTKNHGSESPVDLESHVKPGMCPIGINSLRFSTLTFPR